MTFSLFQLPLPYKGREDLTSSYLRAPIVINGYVLSTALAIIATVLFAISFLVYSFIL
jgi:hypothetical protein